ncbi:UDP-N-acetylglucosamine--N-acetylmuramyl-(pentapeptide) pyrophosphoryl-undecaprenol N-acetylglucosamine transferase [Planctomonas sp. JC2975]|uniref:UDP-N-acetylglucosamine--N-acetylmuramyl- (pentapeptide) pyrophosphoryl-undecaprenol N-acetylglucosamine transferase n=1 Tax=Planctomonas sp. JC2975 TaxID=2729626 RepID=UPI0014747BEE|nr:UDP-N-acetylglucosamine--N-acetylmuramyl-(pentapeptide) pyrophosphoryl-undecaprenol N-acetylglucosamine transferase [Planctomonas sp. JC2975]NNC10406.1 UDP-N-acetylglucosamine--N-acetylmuramyl-(pentapeptide) pyrophosphoryl-undecaprenol N-acetylglucosamine transferase [Planctomonas sp. JC2975]
MTVYLMAGGGTAGHVNPLLAVSDALRRAEPDAEIIVLGTAEGLEARLVPARGYELVTIAKLPFPRRPDAAALRFPARFRSSMATVRRLIESRKVDAVVGFGGYASAPAYSAAHREGIPLVLHEANAKPGMANKLGARYTRFVGVAFENTAISHARFVGMPLRREIEDLDRAAARPDALAYFGLEDRPTLLVTGGSLGARRINATVTSSAEALVGAGYQVLHIQGGSAEFSDPGVDGYHLIDYCDRMDFALAVADAAISRAGAATVSELSALGIPAFYVPYAVGNGEQRFNAAGVVSAGGAVLIDDADFTPERLRDSVLPILADPAALAHMAEAAAAVGVRDGAERMLSLIAEARVRDTQPGRTDRSGR